MEGAPTHRPGRGRDRQCARVALGQRKTRRYEAPGIVVEYEPRRCIHAAECVHGLPGVFDPDARPWVQPDRASADRVAEVIERCPTGALSYRRTDGATGEAPSERNSARVAADGPLYLSGSLRLHLPDGEVLEQTRVALCRCGASENKPFCDNSHAEAEFADPGRLAERQLKAAADGGERLDIRAAPDGPILVEGKLRVVAADGGSAECGQVALCRCGASEAKPYCDGSHKTIGFSAP